MQLVAFLSADYIAPHGRYENGTVWLKVFTPSSVNGNSPVSATAVRTGITWGAVDSCLQTQFGGPCTNQIGASPGGEIPKCGGCSNSDCGGVGCARLAQKTNIEAARSPIDGRCYAYLTHDELCPTAGSDGRKHMWVAFDILDVTNDAAPTRVYQSSLYCASASNTFGSIASVEPGTTTRSPQVAWSYHYQPTDDGCTTQILTQVSSDLRFGTHSYVQPALTFPELRFGYVFGTGDYSGALLGGLATSPSSSSLLFTWGVARHNSFGLPCSSAPNSPYGLFQYGMDVWP